MTCFRFFKPAAVLAGSLGLMACETLPDTVIFGQAHTVGISIGQSDAAPAPEFVLGYKDANIALLPAAVKDAAGNPTLVGGNTRVGTQGYNETFSVFGQFKANTTGPSEVGLGKFFATGIAAQKLAAGFACAVSDGKDTTHCHKPSGG